MNVIVDLLAVRLEVRATRTIVYACMLLAGLVAAANLRAQALITQHLELKTGWNAVYLEVDPTASEPDVLFAGLPVDVVATLGTAPAAQFVLNAGVDLFKAVGWAVWYAPGRPDAFLSNLYAVQGNRPYLLHAATNFTLSVSGAAPPLLTVWTPDAFNFVGFRVQNPEAPTFGQFFAGSPAHGHNRIYRLADGLWRQVLDPGAETMRAGEAFWIYCQGASDYTGPLDVQAPSPFGLILSSQGGADLVVRNRTGHPVAFAVEHVCDPGAPVPLSVAVEALDAADGGLRPLSVNLPAGDWRQELPPLEAGRAIRLPFALRLQDIAPGTRHSLIRVVSDMGTLATIPVTATRDDLTTR